MCDVGDTVSSVVPLLLHINTIIISLLCNVTSIQFTYNQSPRCLTYVAFNKNVISSLAFP